MIGFYFITIGIMIGSILITPIFQFIHEAVSFVWLIGIYFLLAGLWSGYYVYMNEAYNRGDADFGLFFKGFRFSGKLIWQLLLRSFILLPLLAIPYYFLFSEMMNQDVMNNNAQAFQDMAQDNVGNPFGMISDFYGEIFTPTMVWSYVSILLIQLVSSLAFMFSISTMIVMKVSAWRSLWISAGFVMNNFGKVFVVALLLFLMNIGGMLLLYLGLIFTIPFTMCVIHAMFQEGINDKQDYLDEQMEAFGQSEE